VLSSTAIQFENAPARAMPMREKRGIHFGRAKDVDAEQQTLAQRLLEEGKSVREIAPTFSVHPATLYRICENAIS
jgi:DNA invertase Pin-like site-specific DNA recombinase